MDCPNAGRWIREVPVSIMACDKDGTVIGMNNAAALSYGDYGGYELMGRNIRECHPVKALNKLDDMLANGTSHYYTVERNGVKKLLCEVPWYEEGEFKGLVEFSFTLPHHIPHYKRG